MDTGRAATKSKQTRTILADQTTAAASQQTRRRAVGRRAVEPLASIPMEWMDAGSWRLPSGKALAEFALQAGFLAPLLLGSPFFSNGSLPNGARQITVPPVDGLPPVEGGPHGPPMDGSKPNS